jgi:hypothetical protein
MHPGNEKLLLGSIASWCGFVFYRSGNLLLLAEKGGGGKPFQLHPRNILPMIFSCSGDTFYSAYIFSARKFMWTGKKKEPI